MDGKMVCLPKIPHDLDMKYMTTARMNKNLVQTDLVKNLKNRF